MNLFLSGYLILCVLFKNGNMIKKFKSLSYLGINNKIKTLGYQYSSFDYIMQALVIAVVIGGMSYATIGDIAYTFIIVAICVFMLPYFQYQELKSKFECKIEENIFIYVQTALIYLREEKTVFEILTDCANTVDNPLSDDLNRCISHIGMTGDFNEGLDMFETMYPHSTIKNLHILLKGRKNQGADNPILYNYLFNNVEDYELITNDYQSKKRVNRIVFYIMLILDIGSILLMTKTFSGGDMINLETSSFKFVLFIFYILNVITVLGYESWCSKNQKLD
jgi:hypothetical protein